MITFSVVQKMVMWDWLAAVQATKEEWKCTTIDGGRLCVMIPGILLMLMLCADNLVTEEQLQHIKVLTLDRELVLFYWITYSVLELSLLSWDVHTMGSIHTIVDTVKMQELHVCTYISYSCILGGEWQTIYTANMHIAQYNIIYAIELNGLTNFLPCSRTMKPACLVTCAHISDPCFQRWCVHTFSFDLSPNQDTRSIGVLSVS